MNKVIISGRLTRDPELRYSQGAEPIAVVRISVAVSRRFKKEGEPDADFINCGVNVDLLTKLKNLTKVFIISLLSLLTVKLQLKLNVVCVLKKMFFAI